ncbi:MAG: glycosyltransferase [bacterium]
MRKISVIIPSYNASATIPRCLQSLHEQQPDCEFEVIVVDSSDDGTEKLIEKTYHAVKLVHLPEKTMPSRARNVGAAKATGEILAFTDSDCVPDRKWLENIAKNFGNGHEIVGGSVQNGRPESWISRAEYYIEFREFSVNSPKREIRFLPSCNFAIARSLFEHIGGFPDVRASEDTLFAHKLAEQGHKIIFDPEVKIKHLNRNKWRPYLKNQFILGKYAAVVRKVLPMPGGFFVKMPYAFPLLPWVRTLRTLQFILQNSFKDGLQQLFEFLLIYPIFFIGSMVWSYGFYCGIKTPEQEAVQKGHVFCHSRESGNL